MANTRQAVADLSRRLHGVCVRLLRRARRDDALIGLPPGQASALSVLVFGGAKTLGELAEAEQVKPPTMSRIVAGLARSKLVEITADPQDGRRMSIRPSPKGVKLLHEGRQRRIQYLASHLAGLTHEELVQVA